jgi:NTF2 fold immunity protein
MKYFKKILTLFSLLVYMTSCGQNKSDRLILGKKYAEEELKSSLTDTTKHNVLKSETLIIKDSLTATTIAESILFGIYGKGNITKQKPYEVYHIENYWLLKGTLPKDSHGGTFFIILDARNSQTIRISHGK